MDTSPGAPHRIGPSGKIERLAYQQLADSPDTFSEQGRLIIWTGPFGARHVIPEDFWQRNWTAITDCMTPEEITDDLYIHFSRFGKIAKIHYAMLKEFEAFIDESLGGSHTHVPDHIYTPSGIKGGESPPSGQTSYDP